MNKFSVIFVICLVLVFVGSIVMVALLPDFTEPVKEDNSGVQMDEAIWEKTMDDMAAFLVEKGVLNAVDDYMPLVDGIATGARSYNMGFELYWWDVDALKEGSDEAKNYKTATEDESITIFGMSFHVYMQGPFGLGYLDEYTGDVDALIQAFQEYMVLSGSKENELPEEHPIWEKSVDDLAAYLVEQGLLSSADDYQPISDGVATVARYYKDGFEIYWWDVENLESGSDEEANFQTGTAEGYMNVWGMHIAVTMRGPFALGDFTDYTGDVNALIEAIERYCAQ